MESEVFMKRGFSPEDVLKEMKESLSTGEPAPPPDPQTLGSPPIPTIGETYSGSLDDAATLLFNILTPSIRDYAFELADVTLHIPRWQLLLGSMLAQYESGNLAGPSVDPSWRQIEAVIGHSICPECKREFTPKRHKQTYCSNACGDQARGRVIKEEKKKVADFNRKVREGEIAAGRVRMEPRIQE